MRNINTYAKNPETIRKTVSLLRELVEVPSVSSAPEGSFPFGRETALALDTALSIGRRLGFLTENHNYYCGSVILPGEGTEEIGIICHLDVVPAGSGWEFPPFSLTEHENLLIGRGTNDNKGSIAAALVAMEYIARFDEKLPFSVRLLLGCNEEKGMADLPYFLQTRTAPGFSFTPDSDFPVCVGEKGIAEFSLSLGGAGEEILDIHGGTVSNAVADRAEILLEGHCCNRLPAVLPEGISVEETTAGVFIRAAGKAAHAAMPEGSVNAIALLAGFLTAHQILDPASPQAKAFAFLHRVLQGYYGEGLGIEAYDPQTGRLTCIGGTIRLKDGQIIQNFNIRYPVSADMNALFALAAAKTAAEGFAMAMISNSQGYYLSPDREEIAALTKACETVLQRKMQPYVMGGGTYARIFPDTVAFGIGTGEETLALGPGRGGAHQKDEYITRENLAVAIEVFVRALDELAGLKR